MVEITRTIRSPAWPRSMRTINDFKLTLHYLMTFAVSQYTRIQRSFVPVDWCHKCMEGRNQGRDADAWWWWMGKTDDERGRQGWKPDIVVGSRTLADDSILVDIEAWMRASLTVELRVIIWHRIELDVVQWVGTKMFSKEKIQRR